MFVSFCLFLFLSFLHIHAVFHGSNKAAVKKALEFAKICMVGVKENIVNCTILLTPKSNFFCLVYLDFSVCFVVKQPTRVVVHKTAFES
uniref:Secreted protein n=1 Tax=Cyanistes caeruleus TaxID=156563 RepID=A0A8C0U9J8_CYACU